MISNHFQTVHDPTWDLNDSHYYYNNSAIYRHTLWQHTSTLVLLSLPYSLNLSLPLPLHVFTNCPMFQKQSCFRYNNWSLLRIVLWVPTISQYTRWKYHFSLQRENTKMFICLLVHLELMFPGFCQCTVKQPWLCSCISVGGLFYINKIWGSSVLEKIKGRAN